MLSKSLSNTRSSYSLCFTCRRRFDFSVTPCSAQP
jgi:hypothetical protein